MPDTTYEIILEIYYDCDRSNRYTLFAFKDEDEAIDFIKSDILRDYVNRFISNNIGYYREDGHAIYLVKVEYERTDLNKYAFNVIKTIIFEKHYYLND